MAKLIHQRDALQGREENEIYDLEAYSALLLITQKHGGVEPSLRAKQTILNLIDPGMSHLHPRIFSEMTVIHRIITTAFELPDEMARLLIWKTLEEAEAEES